MPLFKKAAPVAPAGLPIYKAEINASMDSDLEVNFIGLVDRPAIERNFQAFRKQQKRANFQIDNEKRIISGPAMIADMPLYRNDEQLGEYYVVFDKQAIRTIVEKFSAKGFMQKFNLFHDDQQQVGDVNIFNSFITDESMGVSAPAAFKDVADGSWFISAQVNNPDVWAKVKDGTIKGFSVEGIFQYLPVTSQRMSKQAAAEPNIEWIRTNLKEFMIRDQARAMACMGATNPAIERLNSFAVQNDLTGRFAAAGQAIEKQKKDLERISKTVGGLFEVMEVLIDDSIRQTSASPTSRRHSLNGKDVGTAEKFAAMARELNNLRHEA